MATPVDVTPSSPRELVIRRVLRATPSAVWRCWSEPELLRQWYCPKPWWVSRAELDLRRGGASMVVMNGPNGEEHENPGQYLVVEPERRLVMTSAFVGDWQPGSTELMLLVFVDIEAHAEGTLLTWGARHWTDADTAAHEAMGFHAGWGVAAEQLEALAASLPGGAA